MTEVSHAEIVQVLESRARDFPLLSFDKDNLSETLVNLFEALDEKYFELSNSHVTLKEELEQHKALVQQTRGLKEQKMTMFQENNTLRNLVSQLNYKMQQLEQSHMMNQGKLRESYNKISDQEKLLGSQSQELLELAQKCADLQNTKYRLQEQVREASEEKHLIELSLNKQIAEIEVVRDRQKTQIKDVNKEIKEYYQELSTLQTEKSNLMTELSQSQRELAEIKEEYFKYKNSNNILQCENEEMRKRCSYLEERARVLEEKEHQLEEVRMENSNLKEKEGNLDLMLQTLSSEKNKLNSEINKMTLEAKANRKHSDDESINTDTAFEHVTDSFRYHSYNPNEDLNKSSQEIRMSEPRRLSMSSSFKANKSNGGLSWEQERIADLENRKNQLEIMVRDLRRQLEERDLNTSGDGAQQPIILFTDQDEIDQNDLIVTDSQQLSVSEDEIEPQTLSITNFQVTILPQMRLMSLYSVPAIKFKPKPRNEVSTQTLTQKVTHQYTIEKPKIQMELNFDQVEITERKTSSSPKSESFFDRLSRMFCGGPSH